MPGSVKNRAFFSSVVGIKLLARSLYRRTKHSDKYRDDSNIHCQYISNNCVLRCRIKCPNTSVYRMTGGALDFALIDSGKVFG